MPAFQEPLQFIKDGDSRRYVADAHQAVTLAEAWDLMAQDPGEGGFYMNSSDAVYKEIHRHMQFLSEHSGSSYSWTMRQIQVIAQNGLDAYRNRFVD